MYRYDFSDNTSSEEKDFLSLFIPRLAQVPSLSRHSVGRCNAWRKITSQEYNECNPQIVSAIVHGTARRPAGYLQGEGRSLRPGCLPSSFCSPSPSKWFSRFKVTCIWMAAGEAVTVLLVAPFYTLTEVNRRNIYERTVPAMSSQECFSYFWIKAELVLVQKFKRL